jgi:protein TonB
MFETSVLAVRRNAQHRALLLTGSLVIHTAAVAAIVLVNLRQLDFPSRSPLQIALFSPTPAVNLPPPAPPAGRAAAQAAARIEKPAAPAAVTAPPIVPDRIPTQPVAGDTTIAGGGSTAADGESSGSGAPGGVPGGIGNAESGSIVDTAPDTVYHVGGNVTAPVVLHRVEPLYPPLAVRAHMSGRVVLECTIDRGGRIREVRVIRSTFGAFEAAAIEAVRQWTFAPGRLNGQPVDTLFELTVNFALQ